VNRVVNGAAGPAFAILRDAQQFIAPLALAEAIGFGLAVTWCVRPRPFGQEIDNERGSSTPPSLAPPSPLTPSAWRWACSPWSPRRSACRIRGTRETRRQAPGCPVPSGSTTSLSWPFIRFREIEHFITRYILTTLLASCLALPLMSLASSPEGAHPCRV